MDRGTLMRRARKTFLAVATLLAVTARAEIYRGIGPLHQLSDLKEMFPGAKFEKLSPAWAQEHDVLYQITGQGLSGTIIVKFFDARPAWRKDAEEAADPEQKTFYESMANEPDDSISVDWVRWVPDKPIPLQRFVSKYGVPEEKGFADEDLQPFRYWKAKGLIGFLTDDEKQVVRVDFEFTVGEQCAAYKPRGYLPPWLKGKCNPPKPAPKSTTKGQPKKQ